MKCHKLDPSETSKELRGTSTVATVCSSIKEAMHLVVQQCPFSQTNMIQIQKLSMGNYITI